MKRFKITYRMGLNPDIEITIPAKSMEDAIIFAKEYRKDAFSIDEEDEQVAKFKIGKTYESYQTEYEPITVVRRTDKTIWVKNSTTSWRMKIRHDKDGNEFAIDSSVPQKWRDAFTYSAKWGEE